LSDLQDAIRRNVRDALIEDLGSGDLTAALIDADAVSGARIIAREPLVLAGQEWVNEVFRQLDERVVIDWYINDGQRADRDDLLCKLVGNARVLLTGERTALNFLQTLSATATETARFVRALEGTGARVLDTRKTIPGLRVAQKYAVRIAGGVNHRMGLFDAILIKENHIKSAGSISNALAAARNQGGDVLIEVEVESMTELREALAAGATRVLLDNFSLNELREAVMLNTGGERRAAELEASGNISLDNLREVAKTGIDYISAGALTKNIRAADLSMLFRID
jgi:nicotinate-nucleotide pyrophosphorylase (carboxylating)